VRISLRNFVTYDNVDVFPGPRLNVVIGPNGSGKSSIVCAIALGLGSDTKILGRASKPHDYIKHGHDTAALEIELKGSKENIVIRREISNESRGDKWLINRRKCKKSDVVDKIRKLNIQIDNLCQFLPQDKVVAFASMDSKTLLIETEKALGGEDMYKKHMKLVEQKQIY